MLASNEPTAASVFRPRTTIDTDGTVEGYASLFGEVDQARDMVMPGAFARTLQSRGLRRIPMLFQHDPAEPIGIWLEIGEDWRGLKARGRLIPEVKRAREVLALVRAGALDGLSHGEGPRRSAHPHPQARSGGPVGNFHRHLPAAGGRARACSEAFAAAKPKRLRFGEAGSGNPAQNANPADSALGPRFPPSRSALRRTPSAPKLAQRAEAGRGDER